MKPAPRIISVAFHIEYAIKDMKVSFYVDGEPSKMEVAAMALSLLDAFAEKLGISREEALVMLTEAPDGTAVEVEGD